MLQMNGVPGKKGAHPAFNDDDVLPTLSRGRFEESIIGQTGAAVPKLSPLTITEMDEKSVQDVLTNSSLKSIVVGPSFTDFSTIHPLFRLFLSERLVETVSLMADVECGLNRIPLATHANPVALLCYIFA